MQKYAKNMVCIQKASAPWTEREVAAEHTADLRIPETSAWRVAFAHSEPTP
jgi:hypothetical protein